MHKQSLLPGFPEGAQKIGVALSILEKDDWVTYFVGGDNYYSHRIDDLQSKRFALASLIANGHVRVSWTSYNLQGERLLLHLLLLPNSRSDSCRIVLRL